MLVSLHICKPSEVNTVAGTDEFLLQGNVEVSDFAQDRGTGTARDTGKRSSNVLYPAIFPIVISVDLD